MITWNKKYNYLDPVRVDGPGGRKYFVNDEQLPSVTTILGATRSKEQKESLDNWKRKVGPIAADRVRDNAATRGTIMHKILEAYLKGEGDIDLTDHGKIGV